jgi:hypothetical protein
MNDTLQSPESPQRRAHRHMNHARSGLVNLVGTAP